MSLKAMRLGVLYCSILLFVVIAAGPARAVCLGFSPGATDPVGEEIRNAKILAWGVIRADVPSDAHGAWSILLDVKRYFRGDGPALIEVTSYSDGDLPPNSDQPGSAVGASKELLKTRAGQEAVVFLSRESSPYASGYRIGCDSSTIDTKGSRALLVKIRSILGSGNLPSTGFSAPAWASIGAGLVIVGFVVRRRRTRCADNDSSSIAARSSRTSSP